MRRQAETKSSGSSFGGGGSFTKMGSKAISGIPFLLDGKPSLIGIAAVTLTAFIKSSKRFEWFDLALRIIACCFNAIMEEDVSVLETGIWSLSTAFSWETIIRGFVGIGLFCSCWWGLRFACAYRSASEAAAGWDWFVSALDRNG